jgi:hypothetical protein
VNDSCWQLVQWHPSPFTKLPVSRVQVDLAVRTCREGDPAGVQCVKCESQLSLINRDQQSADSPWQHTHS